MATVGVFQWLVFGWAAKTAALSAENGKLSNRKWKRDNYISYIIYPVTHQSVYAFSPITLFCGGSPTVSTCTEASLCAFVVGCAWVPSLGRRALLSGAVAPLVQPLLRLPAAAGVALPWHDGMRGSFMRMMCLSSSVFFSTFPILTAVPSKIYSTVYFKGFCKLWN